MIVCLDRSKGTAKKVSMLWVCLTPPTSSLPVVPVVVNHSPDVPSVYFIWSLEPAKERIQVNRY